MYVYAGFAAEARATIQPQARTSFRWIALAGVDLKALYLRYNNELLPCTSKIFVFLALRGSAAVQCGARNLEILRSIRHT